MTINIEKNESEQVRISRKEYRGLVYWDVRVWLMMENGEYVPTRKGFVLKDAEFQKLKEEISCLS